jgi:hypothetical protein
LELGAILHVVASHRRLVAAGAAGTLAIGIVAGHGTARHAGIASANVVVDTRPSDFANSAPGGTDSLVWRAELLADLLTTESNRARVARAAGVPVSELAIVQPLLDVPAAAVALPTYASKAGIAPLQPYLVTLQLDSNLPTIGVRGDAPTRAGAARIAAAAVSILAKNGTTSARETPATDLPADPTQSAPIASPVGHKASQQGLEAFSTGAVRSRTIVYSATKRRVLGLVMAIVLFALWCSAIVLVSGTRRALRAGDPLRSVAAPSR